MGSGGMATETRRRGERRDAAPFAPPKNLRGMARAPPRKGRGPCRFERRTRLFSPRAIAETVDHALSDSRQMREMRENARATVVEHYDLRTRILPQWQSLMATS